MTTKPVNNDVSEREKFQSWILEYMDVKFLVIDDNGDYANSLVDEQWQAWKYATAQQAETIASMQSTIDELTDLLDKAQYCVVIASDYRYNLAGSDDEKCNEYNELNVRIYNKLQALAKVKAQDVKDGK